MSGYSEWRTVQASCKVAAGTVPLSRPQGRGLGLQAFSGCDFWFSCLAFGRPEEKWGLGLGLGLGHNSQTRDHSLTVWFTPAGEEFWSGQQAFPIFPSHVLSPVGYFQVLIHHMFLCFALQNSALRSLYFWWLRWEAVRVPQDKLKEGRCSFGDSAISHRLHHCKPGE